MNKVWLNNIGKFTVLVCLAIIVHMIMIRTGNLAPILLVKDMVVGAVIGVCVSIMFITSKEMWSTWIAAAVIALITVYYLFTGVVMRVPEMNFGFSIGVLGFSVLLNKR